MREKVQFATNVPQVVAIDPRFPEMKRVEGRYGDQVLVSMTENRIAYLEPEVAEQIEALGIQPGQPFSVCKAERREGNRRWLEWRVTRVNGTPGGPQSPGGPAAASAQGDGTHQTHGSNGKGGGASGNGSGGGIPLKAEYGAAMTEFLIAALQAAQKAEQWAGAHNCSVRFTSADVQGLASTLFIQAAREGWLTWRPNL